MIDRCACNDFNRSQFLRAGAARAGAGLPAIEPGMPTPAGTGLSRRSFLLRSAGMALSVYGAGRLLGADAFDEGVAQAAAGGPQRTLVSVFLPGGADSMSILAPVGDPLYAQLRPTLALSPSSGTAFSEDTTMRWHPSASGLATLHGEGKVSVMPAVGYTNANQSHFTSRHFYEVGETNTHTQTGWMGRYLDTLGDDTNPLQGLALAYELAPALASRTAPVAAVPSPSQYDWWTNRVGSPVLEPMLNAFGRLGEPASSSAAMAQARLAAKRADQVRTALAPFAGVQPTPSVTYPVSDEQLPGRLKALAGMLAAGLPIRMVAVNGPNRFNTHSNQAASLSTNLKIASDSILAFQRDLEARGIADRVLIHVWSEFGRRPRENGSGTDHGAAGCGFVVGTKAKGQMIGEFPGLATLDQQSNLRATSDYRAVYCSLLEQWLGADAADVIPNAGSFDRPVLVAA